MRRARWIRLELTDPLEQWPVGAAMAHVQSRESAPIVLWSRFGAPFGCDAHFGFAFIVPVHLAPGKTARWAAWALSPAVATYREFGLRAYLSDADICAQGSRVASGRAERVNGCAVISASLGACSPDVTVTGRAALPERAFEVALRERIQAQHEWEFENSWPDPAEQRAIGDGQPVALTSRSNT